METTVMDYIGVMGVIFGVVLGLCYMHAARRDLA